MRSIFCGLLLIPCLAFSQTQQPSASQLKLKLKKLNFLGSVLYVAAHPDDENTRVIAYFGNERLAATAYLSMTRGNGGQNLIGPEIRDQLGLIRTQELLSARRIDGGQQFFTRANDFGYSKTVDETFSIWGKNEILSDVVRVYRQYQPDVVLTRFPPNERAGHGHHTASAVLAQEAFELSASPSAFPDQLKTLAPWQPKRVYINTGRFFNNEINENTPGVTTLNVGGYNALLGQSYAEIAATSRTQHKSQGFGSQGRRGDAQEFFELTNGDPATKDVFDGVNTSWSRVKGGEKVQPLVERVIKEFDEEKPSASVPLLLQIRKAITALEPSVWRDRKVVETEQLIQGCLGLFAEVTADNYWVAPGEKVISSFEIINRSPTEVLIEKIQAPDLSFDSTLSTALKNNVSLVFKTAKQLNSQKTYSDPYWLREPHSPGLFSVKDANLIGKPENNPSVPITFTFSIGGDKMQLTVPLVYKWTDPVKGEQYRPFEVLPPVLVKLPEHVIVFGTENFREVQIVVKATSGAGYSGSLKLSLPPGWQSEPASIPFSLTTRGEEQIKTFKVYPSKSEVTGTMKVIAEVSGKIYDLDVHTIQYDHIPMQTLLPKAEAKVVRIDLKKEGGVVGYISGAGDDIPSALRTIGYEVWEMKDEEVTVENLRRVDAVVLGIRALNTNERIGFMMKDLLNYVQQGGTLVMQYNVSNGLKTDKFSPYPLTLSRDRVSEENAEVRILKPEHPLMNTPNKITAADFTGWEQERGLHFPNKWDENYEALLSMNDSGEKPLDGGLLVARYGSGYYVYTSLSFFRELPEGVPGAFKLFVNMVSLGKPKKLETSKVKNKTR
jgi:LmbE family N-acetylglucosaminyl deacetylase